MNKDGQLTSSILMVRPKAFRFNEMTSKSNAFQEKDSAHSNQYIQDRALVEFDVFVAILREVGIRVEVFEDLEHPNTPDAVFPNNWISFHENNTVILYPLLIPNRRDERREDIITYFKKKVPSLKVIDYTHYEKEHKFLESTGSIVMDRENQIAYACSSPRTDPTLFKQFCDDLDCKGVIFNATDKNNIPIYHTNVMMSVNKGFTVVCMESISDRSQRNMLEKSFAQTGHDLIEINLDQLHQFAGNMIQLKNTVGNTYLLMSKRAHDSLGSNQLETLRSKTELLVIPIDVIELNGGGSVRCMIAEIFLDY